MSDSTETTTTTETEPTTEQTEAATAPDLAAEVDKWKALARKNEARAKENAAAAKELETLKASQLSEQERAVENAKVEARAEAMREVGTRLVDAEFKAAASGRDIDVDVLLDGLDRSRFLDDDGNPDTAAISAWVDRLAPSRVDIGQGQRGKAAPVSDPLEAALREKLGITT